ncbi:response regulator transcription factor [Thalassotalea sp. PLHSN55]|uniref:response regulator transcription factor n=1 Tax=Thalassotalea sp. PLHSN55 TaxID=3435888 RepID=UPI003F86A275
MFASTSSEATNNNGQSVEPKVIIADDHPLFRTALKQAIIECIDDANTLEAESFDELLSAIEKTPSLEIVFLDLHMPGNNGFTGLTQLQNHYPDLVVIMVSSDDNSETMQKAINFGAAAFIPKSADLNTIASAIDTVLEGDIWLPENIEANIDEQQVAQHQKLAKQLAQLTPQQYVVLTRIADGQLNKQIAYDLDIKETTVKKHVSAILLKLDVNNRTLAGLAYQQLMLAANEHEQQSA